MIYFTWRTKAWGLFHKHQQYLNDVRVSCKAVDLIMLECGGSPEILTGTNSLWQQGEGVRGQAAIDLWNTSNGSGFWIRKHCDINNNFTSSGSRTGNKKWKLPENSLTCRWQTLTRRGFSLCHIQQQRGSLRQPAKKNMKPWYQVALPN